MRKQLKSDLYSANITAVCPNIYYLHKSDDIKCNKYIEYEIISELDTEFCSDRKLATDYIIQVDVFSKFEGDFVIMDTIKETLLAKGYGFSSSFDAYENDTKLYHFAMRFTYKKIF